MDVKYREQRRGDAEISTSKSMTGRRPSAATFRVCSRSGHLLESLHCDAANGVHGMLIGAGAEAFPARFGMRSRRTPRQAHEQQVACSDSIHLLSVSASESV